MFSGREIVEDLHYLNVEHLGSVAADRKAVLLTYIYLEMPKFRKTEAELSSL